MLDPTDPVFKTAVFGKQVEEFLKGDLGAYLLARAQEDAESAMDKLKTTATWRKRRIQQLQNEIYRAESFRDWLGDALQAGINATATLEDEHG